MTEEVENCISPRQQWYREVYLTSEYWKNKKQEILEHYNNKCCLCESVNSLDIHHLCYLIDETTPVEEWCNKGEDARSLVVLCRDCHSHIHNVKQEEEIKIRRLLSKYSNIFKNGNHSVEQNIFMYWQEVNEIIVSAMESFFKGRKTKHLMRLSSYFNSREFFKTYNSLQHSLLSPIYHKVRREILPTYSQLYSQRNNPTKNKNQ